MSRALQQALAPAGRRSSARTAVLVFILAVGGCGSFGGFRERDRGPDLADVIADLPEPALAQAPDSRPDRETVLAAYAAIEGRLDDPSLNQAVGRRVADLTMSVAEDRAADGAAGPYDEALQRYTDLLEQAEGDDRAEVLYQLARAYEMAGSADRSRTALDQLILDHPDHPLVVEARFRRAEMAFSAERWTEAEADYGFVVTRGMGSAWWLNAAYMSGWTRFKSGDPEAALERFYLVLGKLDEQSDDPELRNDTLRVATLALDYLDGPDTLAQAMRGLGRPQWQYALYAALAESYLERERFLDSVATWQTYIDEQPLDARAPGAHKSAIDILLDADFPTEARESQARFVAAYGIHSEFWNVHDASVRQTYLASLKDYLDVLAKGSHATAQQSGDAAAFTAAAHWYDELIQTFPADPDTAGYLFMLGELHTESGNTRQAVVAYQRVMREYPEFPGAAEAGYAAILGLESLAAAAPAEEGAQANRARIDAQVEFATRFPADPHTPAVSAAAADGLFALGDHAAAVAQAEALIAANPTLEASLRTTALTVLGHGRFELADFAGAESAYRELHSLALEPDLRDDVTERLQAAIYRQAEASERSGDADAAIAHYLRVGDPAPDSELAIQAQFDAIAVLETNGRTAEAARQLDEFRTRHPGHALAADAPRRLASLYEQTGDVRLAGAAWLEVSGSDPDSEVRRQALYRAAELALEAADPAAALRHFTAYAEQYPRPADLRMEALDQLDKLTHASGDTIQRKRWLAAKIELERGMHGEGAPAETLARAAGLAAAAQLELARDARAAFDAIPLVNPLAASLERKQQALLEALAAFEAAAAYEVAEYVTASTWEIGDLYSALARALLDSERPPGLTPEALEEYEMLLEEQAFPFEEQAIALHEINVQRSWAGRWDPWIERSFDALRHLVPARFDRPEQEIAGPVDGAPGCDARTGLAVDLRRRGDFGAAEAEYLSCIAEQPDYGPAYLNLGILYELYLGRPEAALDAYRRYQSLAAEPDPRVSGWMQQIEHGSGA